MISEQAAVMNNLPQGAYLVEITPESTAATLGLEAGDVLTTINSSKLSESNDLIKIVNSLSIGDKIEVTFWRKGEALTKSGTVQGLQN